MLSIKYDASNLGNNSTLDQELIKNRRRNHQLKAYDKSDYKRCRYLSYYYKQQSSYKQFSV
jgi:hypothetical protein